VEAEAVAPETPDGYELYATTVTDQNGYYEFDGLFPGAYMVAEEVREDWTQTLAPEEGFSIIENGTHITDLNFGNQEPFAPFTPEEKEEAEEEEEEFLPFTGADIAGLVLAIGLATALGAGLRRTSRRLR
jgi:hypothetical protein